MRISTLSILSLPCALVFLLAFPADLSGQDKDQYIYGKVLTRSGDQFEGFMRWGKEELLWHDVFNSEKVHEKSHDVRKSDEKSSWWNIDWKWSSIWEDKYRTTAHMFACFFGDIKTLEILDNSRVDLELKDGSVIKLNGGSNDIGATIQLHDDELGLVKFDWNRIQRIEFSQAVSIKNIPYADVLYGTVHTRRNGEFRGYIKWDLDERILDDILDGESRPGDRSIAFAHIASIIKHDNGAKVKLHSGEEMFLNGSNDVNAGNRGIAVYVDEIGNVEIPWSDFKDVSFQNAPSAGVTYNSFKRPDGIRGVVETFSNGTHSGRLSFDIDEVYEIEFLDGKDNNISYQIPFRNIQSVTPKNQDFSLVTLKNGDVLLLGDTQDVSYNNDGVLVFKEKQKDPYYIAWKDIDVIRIK